MGKRRAGSGSLRRSDKANARSAVKPSYYKKKFFFSIRERILLHLARLADYGEEMDVPDALTQFGIADAVRAGRSTCSKLLQSLEEGGYIHGRRAHIPGAHIRRTVYFLTPLGVREAEAVGLRVASSWITVRLPGGGVRKMRVGEVARHLPIYTDLVDIATWVSRGVFDAEAFLKFMEKQAGPVEALDFMPRPRRFLGRAVALAQVEKWRSTGDTCGLILLGPPGIGKTALASQVVQALRGKAPLLWYRVYAGSTVREVAQRFGAFLARMNRKALHLYLEGRRTLEERDVLGLLTLGLEGGEALVVIDGLSRGSPQVQGFLLQLSVALGEARGPKLLITSRALPDWGAALKGFQVLELQGLSGSEASHFLSLRNIPEELHGRIYRWTQGNPLLLELVHGEPEGPRNAAGFLREHVLSRLLPLERDVLAIASVHREPPVGVALLPPDEHVVLASLVDQGLLRALLPKAYEPLDLVRDVVLAHTPGRLLRELHAEASQFHLAQGDPAGMVEALHHLVKAGDLRQAIQLALEWEPQLVAAGLGEDLEVVVDSLVALGPRAEVRLGASLLKGRLLLMRGQPQEALGRFEATAALAKRMGLEVPGALALEGFGEASLALGKPREAQQALEATLRVHEAERDGGAGGRIHHLLGLAALAEGQPNAAVRSFRAALRAANRASDPNLPVDILLEFGRAYGLKGNAQKALSYKQRALRLALRSGGPLGLCRVHLALARDLWDVGDEGRGLEEASRANEAARQVGDPGLMLEAGLLLGLLRLTLGNPLVASDLAGLERLAAATGRTAAIGELRALRGLGDLQSQGGANVEALMAAIEGLESKEGPRWWVALYRILAKGEPSRALAALARAVQDSRGRGGLLVRHLEALERAVHRPTGAHEPQGGGVPQGSA